MSATEYFTPSGIPGTATLAASLEQRTQWTAVQNGFGKMPDLSGNANLPVFVNGSGDALTAASAADAISYLGLPTSNSLKLGVTNYGTTTGTANTYAVSLSNVTALADGQLISVKINVSNSGSSGINVSGLGEITIKRMDGADVVSGDLVANYIYDLRYNSSTGYWHLVTYPYKPGTTTYASYTTITTTTFTAGSSTVNGASYAKTFNTPIVQVDISGGVYTIDLSLSDTFWINMTASGSILFTNEPATGLGQTVHILVDNDGSYTFTGFTGTTHTVRKPNSQTITSPAASTLSSYVVSIFPDNGVILVAYVDQWDTL